MIKKNLILSSLFALSVSISGLQASPLKLSNRGINDYENSTWVEDWTDNLDTDYFISNLPRGVNTINVFVGELALVNGTPSINGYTLDTPGTPAGTGAFPNINALTDFVKRCKAEGCLVKLSIGGQAGTTFGTSWNCLTTDNIDAFAQALISMCKTTGADGIDFDYEQDDTTIATLAGKLAGRFRDFDTAYQYTATCCVFAGCDASGPWHAADTAFLTAATTAQGWCAIDRVYVMAYWDSSTLAQNEQYMLAWNTWLGSQHGFSSIRISAGVDPTDPITSPDNGSLKSWISFAQQNGFSTAIWDQSGVNNYVTNDWGTTIDNLYLSSASTSTVIKQH